MSVLYLRDRDRRVVGWPAAMVVMVVVTLKTPVRLGTQYAKLPYCI
jgi:hypothetical protein